MESTSNSSVPGDEISLANQNALPAEGIGVLDEAAVAEKQVEITRFNLNQIVQHIVMMSTFTLLVFTGLPMKFNSLAISEAWATMWGGISVLRTVHHLSAYVMVGLCFYHLGCIAYSVLVQKKPFPVAMLPSVQDFVKFYQEFLYFLGLRKVAPSFDRFNWREKFDYWAIFWGMPVMGISGFVLMFPVLATRLLPGWVIPVAFTAHSHEAMLALLWIFLVHVFFNHFTPGVFPLNKSIFTGKVPEDRYRRDHAIEYERIQKERMRD
jgi:formate dehydrogenase subunit gamma